MIRPETPERQSTPVQVVSTSARKGNNTLRFILPLIVLLGTLLCLYGINK